MSGGAHQHVLNPLRRTLIGVRRGRLRPRRRARVVGCRDVGRRGGSELLRSRSILLSISGAGLAGVSSYLLYVLAVPLGGAECVYCLTSAAISFTLFAIGFSGLSPKETGRLAPVLIAVYAITVLGFSLVLGGDSEKTNIADLKLPYAAPVIGAVPSYSRAVAKHLRESGRRCTARSGALTARIRRRRSGQERTYLTWSVSPTDGRKEPR